MVDLRVKDRYELEWLFWVSVTCALIARMFIFSVGQPLYLSDSDDYLAMATWMRALDFSAYVGKRMPGYPFVVLVLGNRPLLIWVTQAVLGIIATGCLYHIMRKLGACAVLACLSGCFFSVTPAFVLMETAILTESLCMSLVVVVIVIWLSWISSPRPYKLGIIGCLWAYLSLTRPIFIMMPFLCLGWMMIAAWRQKIPLKILLLWVTLILGPTIVAIGGWVGFNDFKIGQATLNVNASLGFVNHFNEFMELAAGPDRKYAVLYAEQRELHRKEMIIMDGSPTIIQYFVYKECKKQYQISDVEYRKVFSRISLQLLRSHPILYLRSVIHAWLNFWRIPLVWDPILMNPPWIRNLIVIIWWPFKILWLVLVAIFLLKMPVLITRGLSSRLESRHGVMGLLSMIIVSTSLVQALLEYGENSRYALPILPVLLIVVSVTLSCTYSPEGPQPC